MELRQGLNSNRAGVWRQKLKQAVKEFTCLYPITTSLGEALPTMD